MSWNPMNDIKSRLERAGFRFSQEIPRKASFIMQDGSFLDMRGLSHSDLEGVFLANGITASGRDNLLRGYGAIQVNDGTYEMQYECAYARLPDSITQAQGESLLRWLDRLMTDCRKAEVTVAFRGKLSVIPLLCKKSPDGALPDDIIKDIRRENR